MSKRLLPIFAAIVALFSSCANDDEAGNGGKVELESGAICTIAPVEYVGEFESRADLTLGTGGMDFRWYQDREHPENSDKLSIFYSDADQTAGIYTLSDITNDQGTSAKFNSDGFKLTAEKRYFAISTVESKAPTGVSIPDKRNIVLTYAGQVQKGNKSTSHLGQYAYMAASGVAEGDDHVNLDFVHLGLTLRIIMEGLPSGVKFNKMEMYDTENSYLQPVRGFDMTSGLANDGTYTPALKPVDVNSAQYKASDRFTLKLQQDNANPELGIEAGSNGVASGRLEMFIEVPPANLTGKDLIFMVYGDNNKAYYIKCSGRDLVAGRAYQMKGTAQEASTYYVRIKVNHEWQLGTTLSRGTGDPGYDEKFDLPEYIYYILCVDGKVKSVNGHAVTEIENIPDGKWAPSADKTIITYVPDTPLSFSFAEGEKGESHTRNLYIVASKVDLSPTSETSIFKNIAASDEESEVRNLVYSINTSDTQANTQAFMKNLYSTPWTTTNFVGNLGNDYFKDIILYHVAAKVDLKWNSATSVVTIDSENPENTKDQVKVSGVQSTNLSLFQPATVNGTGVFVKGGEDPTYTVTSVIEEDRQFYGRQVFYLPQMASAAPNTSTYNVTIGNKAAENVNFQPVTTGGFTSWMRWLRQY